VGHLVFVSIISPGVVALSYTTVPTAAPFERHHQISSPPGGSLFNNSFFLDFDFLSRGVDE
jgi:hypothetical protein